MGSIDRLQAVQLVQLEAHVDFGRFGVQRVPDKFGDGGHGLGLGNGFEVIFPNLDGNGLQTNNSFAKTRALRAVER